MIKIEIINPLGISFFASDFVIYVDVPDREENYTNREITDADAGITIYYATDEESKIKDDFIIEEPHILPASKSNAKYAVVSASNSEFCNVKLYNNSGGLTTGFVNIRARGY